jgi:hypothetical protein
LAHHEDEADEHQRIKISLFPARTAVEVQIMTRQPTDSMPYLRRTQQHSQSATGADFTRVQPVASRTCATLVPEGYKVLLVCGLGISAVAHPAF